MKTSRSSSTHFKVIRYPQVDSTNRIAVDLGNQGAAHGTVLQADQQSGGRGRQSRHFFSPPGGMYISAIIRPQLPVEELALITLAAGIACAEAIEKTSGVPVQLKWPNDLYANGKKLGGILTEAAPYSQATRDIPFIVVGVGLNVNTRTDSFPDSLQDLATSLYCISGHEQDIDKLLHLLLKALFAEVSLLQESREEVLAHWGDRDFLVGKKLSWQDPQGKIVHGTGSGLLPDGRYRLTTSGGDDYPVLAGDIRITDINGLSIK